MTEYINKDILYKKVVEKEKYLDELLANAPSGSIEEDVYLEGLTGILWVKQLIANTPSEDVKPVVHGRRYYNDEGFTYCSECGKIIVGDSYCEYCGAILDLE